MFRCTLTLLAVAAASSSSVVAQTLTPSGPGLRAGVPVSYPVTAEQATILSHMSLVDLPDGLGGTRQTLRISGLNVQIVNGSGTTDGPVDGLGNLIVGYNELRGVGDDRTGSHNLIVGARQNVLSYGGLVAGGRNEVSGIFSSVSGGESNTASGAYSSVSGGQGNTASGLSSSVSGGQSNTARGINSSVSGGASNTASGSWSSVSGGFTGSVSGFWDWRAGTLFEQD